MLIELSYARNKLKMTGVIKIKIYKDNLKINIGKFVNNICILLCTKKFRY